MDSKNIGGVAELKLLISEEMRQLNELNQKQIVDVIDNQVKPLIDETARKAAEEHPFVWG